MPRRRSSIMCATDACVPRRSTSAGTSTRASAHRRSTSRSRILRARRHLDAAIESKKPTHFIYAGLKQALARMRAIATAGGWPAVAAGRGDQARSERPSRRHRPEAAARHRRARERDGRRATRSTTPTLPVSGQELSGAPSPHGRRRDREGDDRRDERHRRARVQQLRVNLERARWVIGGLSDTFVLVNLPAFKVYLIRDGKNVWETRTQIGSEARQTPSFRADMKYLVFNPDWTVPPTILAQDVLAGMRKGREHDREEAPDDSRSAGPRRRSRVDRLADARRRGNFRYTLRQPPGPDNALGRVKFIFPNQHSIFLHDTPSRELFTRRPAHVQLGLHPRRAPARSGGGAARGAGELDAGAHPGGRRRRASRRPCSCARRCRSSSSTGPSRSAPPAICASPTTSITSTRRCSARSESLKLSVPVVHEFARDSLRPGCSPGHLSRLGSLVTNGISGFRITQSMETQFVTVLTSCAFEFRRD